VGKGKSKEINPMQEAQPIKVQIEVKSELVTPAQKEAWQRFWQRIIAEVKDETRSARNNG
jgi:hypothetical protein